ncbi:MAG: discoidin domain-containing protein [Limisphaerales bacterium]
MSEFKFACPVCGQHIKCGATQAGSIMTCPTCFQKITVPNAPATPEQKFILAGTKVGGERPKPKISDTVTFQTTRPEGFPGAIIVVIILGAVLAIAALIYYETIFKDSHRPPHPSAGASTISHAALGNPVSGDNLALRAAAFASTEQPPHPAAHGNDGDLTTRWCASNGSAPQWWTVDLDKTVTITNVQIAWEHVAAYRYVIEASPDNSTWSVVADRSGAFTPLDMTSDSFSARARFLRVVITGLPPGSWASFYEFRAFGSIDGK